MVQLQHRVFLGPKIFDIKSVTEPWLSSVKPPPPPCVHWEPDDAAPALAAPLRVETRESLLSEFIVGYGSRQKRDEVYSVGAVMYWESAH